MKFIENHQAHVFQRRIALQQPGQHAFRHHFDPCVRRNTGIPVHPVADGPAHRFAKQRRHVTGDGPGRQPARLQHNDFAAGQPGLAK